MHQEKTSTNRLISLKTMALVAVAVAALSPSTTFGETAPSRASVTQNEVNADLSGGHGVLLVAQRDVSPTRPATVLSGRVVRIDQRAETFRIADDRENDETRIDASQAKTASGAFRLSSIAVGDAVEITGRMDSTGTLIASSIQKLATGRPASSETEVLAPIRAEESVTAEDIDDRAANGREIRTTTENSSPRAATPIPDERSRTLTALTGRIVRLDPRAKTFRMVTGPRSGEILVDTDRAVGSGGGVFRFGDIQIADTVEVTGRYDSVSSFIASTVRFSNAVIEMPRPSVSSDDDDDDEDDDEDEAEAADDEDDEDEDLAELRREESRDEDGWRNGRSGSGFSTVVIYGIVREGLDRGGVLLVEDTNEEREVSVYALDEFAVKLRSGSFIKAHELKEGDRVVIEAFRMGNRYVAQTMRMR